MTLQITELIKTRAEFLTCKTYSEAVNKLGLTSNTIRYRLEKLKILTGEDFRKNFSFEVIKKLKKKIRKEILDGKYRSMNECANSYGTKSAGYLGKIVNISNNDFGVIRRLKNSQKVMDSYSEVAKKLGYFPSIRKLKTIKHATLISKIYYYFSSFEDFLSLVKSRCKNNGSWKQRRKN